MSISIRRFAGMKTSSCRSPDERVLDVGSDVRRDALVQHRLVVEAGQGRHGRRRVERDAIELDRRGPARTCDSRRTLERVGESGRVRHVAVGLLNQPQIPRPAAVGSRSQSGGVSQTNARMAIDPQVVGERRPLVAPEERARERRA